MISPLVITLHIAVVLVLVVVVGDVGDVLESEGDDGWDVAGHLTPALAHHRPEVRNKTLNC